MPPTRSLARTLIAQILRRNRSRLLKRVAGRRDAPWMRPFEEDLIRDLLAALQPRRCLEWGGGLSTLQFPALLPADATWLTVEHDEGWARELGRRVSRPGVQVRHVPADDRTFHGDGDASSFANYLAAGAAGAPYDFVFIDGRARAAAVERARDVITPEGIVVLHDANRDAYLASTAPYAQQELFRDGRRHARRPAGGVWIGSPARPIGSVLDLELHRRVWNFYAGPGRLFA